MHFLWDEIFLQIENWSIILRQLVRLRAINFLTIYLFCDRSHKILMLKRFFHFPFSLLSREIKYSPLCTFNVQLFHCWLCLQVSKDNPCFNFSLSYVFCRITFHTDMVIPVYEFPLKTCKKSMWIENLRIGVRKLLLNDILLNDTRN